LEVQRILGHRSILTTARYTHLTSRTQDNAVQVIDGLMGQVVNGWEMAR